MEQYTEKIDVKNGDKITIYLNTYEEEDYTVVAGYFNNDCIFVKRVHGIYTSTNDFPDHIANVIINYIAPYVGYITEEAIDCKFID